MSERDQFETWARSDVDLRITLECQTYADIAWMAWQASREALKAEQVGDSDLLASAKKLEQEVGGIVEQLKQINSDGFMCVPVADLYELQNKDGSAYCYSTSSSEAHGWVKEGYTIQEYVTLERLQDAINEVVEYPDKLPCPVLLEPGMRFGKGVATRSMLGALQRRAEYYAELELMTPEERAQQHEDLRNFLNIKSYPIDTTSQQYETLAKGEVK